MRYHIQGLKKQYGERTVLDIPEMTLDGGHIHALLGPNGSGKTTLLSILGFLEPPSQGELIYQGKAVPFFREKTLQALRKEVVCVDQHPILFSTSVYKNVAFGPRIRGESRPAIEQRVRACLEQVGMADFMDAPAHKLSGGETQRVAIARALACQPRAILLDEPTASVDVSNQITIERILQDLHQEQGIAIIFSTHDLSQAGRLNAQKVYLFEGKPSSRIHENLFAGELLRENSRHYCRIAHGFAVPVNHPGEDFAKNPIKLSLDPSRLWLSQPEGKPSLGQANGRVVQLSQDGEGVRAVVDLGFRLNVILERDRAGSLSLGIGTEVTVHCPPEAVQILE